MSKRARARAAIDSPFRILPRGSRRRRRRRGRRPGAPTRASVRGRGRSGRGPHSRPEVVRRPARTAEHAVSWRNRSRRARWVGFSSSISRRGNSWAPCDRTRVRYLVAAHLREREHRSLNGGLPPTPPALGSPCREPLERFPMVPDPELVVAAAPIHVQLDRTTTVERLPIPSDRRTLVHREDSERR